MGMRIGSVDGQLLYASVGGPSARSVRTAYSARRRHRIGVTTITPKRYWGANVRHGGDSRTQTHRAFHPFP